MFPKKNPERPAFPLSETDYPLPTVYDQPRAPEGNPDLISKQLKREETRPNFNSYFSNHARRGMKIKKHKACIGNITSSSGLLLRCDRSIKEATASYEKWMGAHAPR